MRVAVPDGGMPVDTSTLRMYVVVNARRGDNEVLVAEN